MIKLRMLVGVYAGRVREFPNDVAKHLLNVGFAEEVDKKTSSIPTEVEATPSAVAEVPIPKPKRGRGRKKKIDP